jgi:quinol monooxygenase YgiN
MITVLAFYRTTPETADQVAADLFEYAKVVNTEPGCIAFRSLADSADPNLFVLYEVYRDQEAFDAHVASEHYAAIAVDRIRPILASREVLFLDDVADPATPTAPDQSSAAAGSTPGAPGTEPG